MNEEVTACFVGLGSIGRRHLRNLHVVAKGRGLALVVDALRHEGGSPLDAETATLIRREYTNSSALGQYDLLYICNPSQLHYETLCHLKDKAAHFLIEKPFAVKPLSEAELSPIDDESRYYVACPMRHTKLFGFIKDFVAQHKIFCARAICSSYLPEWRPNQDYRKLYSASKESGGVKLDLIHEFDYLFTLFGMPSKHTLIEGKYSNLEIESSDLVSFVGEYPDKTVELHLDYFGRVPRRSIELYTAEDVVTCDFVKSEVRFLKMDKIVSFPERRDDYCQREEEYFLDFHLTGVENINPLRHANKILGFVADSDFASVLKR